MKGEQVTRIHIPDNMLYITEGVDVVEVNGGTVGECLRHLVRKSPRMEKQLFDDNMVPK
jgi:hypothetical protein